MIGIVLAIFAIIAIGAVARHLLLLSENSYRTINDYVYYISIPLLIFSKLASTQIGPQHVFLAAANLLPIAIIMLLVAALWKLRVISARLSSALVISAFFGNIIYMGFPIIQLRFGEGALAEAAIISFVYNVAVFTAGIALVGFMTGRKWRGFAGEKLSRNTIIWACVAGVAVSLAGLSLPSEILGIFSSVGATTVPLALFSMGFFLYGRKIGKNISKVAILCAFKMLIYPAIFIASALAIGLRGQLLQVSLLEAFMPLAVTNFVIAEKFGAEKDAVAQAVLASTVLSIPLLMGFDWIFGMLHL